MFEAAVTRSSHGARRPQVARAIGERGGLHPAHCADGARQRGGAVSWEGGGVSEDTPRPQETTARNTYGPT